MANRGVLPLIQLWQDKSDLMDYMFFHWSFFQFDILYYPVEAACVRSVSQGHRARQGQPGVSFPATYVPVFEQPHFYVVTLEGD